MCLDLDVIPVMFVEKSNNRMSVLFSSLQTMGTAKGIWREPFTHPVISSIHVTQQK